MTEEDKMLDVIKNIVYSSLQWQDGEITGFDEQVIRSLAPDRLKPWIDTTDQLKSDLDAAIEFIEGIEAEANNNVLDCSRILRRIKK